jgi:anti-anti-sigma regulatory factor
MFQSQTFDVSAPWTGQPNSNIFQKHRDGFRRKREKDEERRGFLACTNGTAFPLAQIFSVRHRKLHEPRLISPVSCTKRRSGINGTALAHKPYGMGETFMLSLHVENVGEMAVIECDGRIVQSDAALKLRRAVDLQSDCRIIVLDLSKVPTIEGGGLGMLVFLQRWAQNHDIRLKLFNPRESVRYRLERASSMREFDIATLDEMMALLAHAHEETRQQQHSIESCQ